MTVSLMIKNSDDDESVSRSAVSFLLFPMDDGDLFAHNRMSDICAASDSGGGAEHDALCMVKWERRLNDRKVRQ